jgi:hypothetical protein
MKRLSFILLLFFTSCGPYYWATTVMHPKYMAVYPAPSLGVADPDFHIGCFLLDRDIPPEARRITIISVRGSYSNWNRVIKKCLEYQANAVHPLSTASYGTRNGTNTYTQYLLLQVPDSTINKPN